MTRRRLMTTVIVVVGSLVAIVVLIAGVGYFLPVGHSATREHTYNASVDKLFAAVATPAEYPRWRRGITGVEQLPAQAGKPTFREMGSFGPMTFIVDEIVPERRMITRIADTTQGFGGKWTYEFLPEGQGSRLRITEDGQVYNPIFRFMARFVFGYTRTMENYHSDLEQHLTARSDSARQ